jgi:hypothetical protein
LSLFTSLVAATGALFIGHRSKPGVSRFPFAIPHLAVWIAALAIMVACGLEIGSWASVDYVPARGVLAGALCGIIVAGIIRSKSTVPATQLAAVFGISTALICGCRLWLTHGEVSGLIAADFSYGVTLLCLAFAPTFESDSTIESRLNVAALCYMTILTAAVLLGFTRASTLGDGYWADVPLMFGAALSIGLFIASTLTRRGTTVKALAVIVVATAVLTPLAITVLHSLAILGLTALGMLVVAMPLILIVKLKNSALPDYLGFVLLIAGVTVAFTVMSGYGLAFFALGVIVIVAVAGFQSSYYPVGGIAFVALLLIYRLEVLQNGSSVRAIGPGDMWDLLAISIGILLPSIVGAWIENSKRLDRAGTIIQWVLALSIPAVTLDYIWQPRSLTGLFLGLAVGQIGAVKSDNAAQSDLLPFNSLLIGLLLFIFLPGLDTLTAPTRIIRISVIAVLSVLIVIKILVSKNRVTSPSPEN